MMSDMNKDKTTHKTLEIALERIHQLRIKQLREQELESFINIPAKKYQK